MSELYVYYRLCSEQAEAARAAFESARASAPVRLLERQDPAGSTLLTWMEIYGADVEDPLTVEQRLAQALEPFLQGTRHIEIFDAVC